MNFLKLPGNLDPIRGSLLTVHHYDWIIANHDGEDSDNWEAFYYPLGDARRALNAFVALLQGHPPSGVEEWEADLLP